MSDLIEQTTYCAVESNLCRIDNCNLYLHQEIIKEAKEKNIPLSVQDFSHQCPVFRPVRFND
jgi:hypothetical protein